MKTLSRAARGWLIGLAVVVALYAVIGFFVVPGIAHRQVEQRGSAALEREVTLGDFGFNPFTFVAGLDQLRVAGRDGDEPLLTLDRAELNFDAFESLIRWQWRFGDVTLTGPNARLAVDENGELSIADLLGGPEEQEGGGIPQIGVDQLTVQGGSVAFDDRSRQTPFRSVVQPITFTLNDFSTAPGVAGNYRLSGNTESGETFTWSGSLGAAPFVSQGRIEFTSLDLPSYEPFLSGVFAGGIRSGRADLTADYEVSLGEQRRAVLRNGRLRLADLALTLPEADQPAVVLPALEVEVPEVDLFARSAHVTHVTLDGLEVAIVRQSDGSLDLAQFVAGSTTDAGREDPATDADAAGQFSARVDRIALQNGTVRFSDRTNPEPAQLHADQIALTLTGVSTDPAAEAGVELSLRWMEGPGTLNASGTVTRAPLDATLQMAGSQLELAAAAPYLQPFVEVRIDSGRVEFDGRLELAQADAEPIALGWTGRIGVEELATRDRAFEHEFVGWSRLAFEGVDFNLAPRRLAVREIRLEQPAFNVLLGPEGRTNLTAAMGGGQPDEAATESAAAPGTQEQGTEPRPGEGIREASAAMPIALESFVIAGGRVTLIDRSGPEPFEAAVTEIEGSLRGLSTERNEAGELALTALVTDSARATVKGQVNLVGTDVFSGSDVTLELREVGLDRFEPYIVRFLGYRVQQGRMLGDFDYRLSGGDLDGKNHIVLDDFYLGEPVESPDALAVPVKLALAVLRNREGEVVLDVPVSGSLTSPEFSFAQAIRGAFGNILGRVASAPFALLGSMFGAPEMDLSLAEFPPGAVELTDETRRKLEVLARALQERPGLKLVIEWQPTPEADREAAREQRLNELLAQQREQLAASAGREVTDVQALRALFAERILDESADSTEAAPEESAETETERERRSWYVQVWNWVWGPWPEERAPTETRPPAESAPVEPQIGEEQMRRELLASIEVDQGMLESLARSRAENARDRLVEAGIEAQRIEIARQADEPPREAAETALVQFELAQADGTMMAE